MEVGDVRLSCKNEVCWNEVFGPMDSMVHCVIQLDLRYLW